LTRSDSALTRRFDLDIEVVIYRGEEENGDGVVAMYYLLYLWDILHPVHKLYATTDYTVSIHNIRIAAKVRPKCGQERGQERVKMA